jgi:predicted ferric reductase
MVRAKKFSIWLWLGLANIIPILIWLTMKPWGERFGGGWQILTSVGQISALLGFSLMATTIILISRVGIIERASRGLNRVFINHHILGAISFVLLLLHPVSLALRYLSISFHSALSFLFPGLVAWPRLLGNASLFIMLVLLFITFYLGWRYHFWKFSHRFLMLAFVIGLLHVAFISSDVSLNLFLRAYLLALAGLALLAYAYRLIVEFSDLSKHEYVVSAKRELALGVIEISLRPSKTAFSYHSGQFAFLKIKQKGLSQEEHPFSFVSAPYEEEIKFGIKALGDYTKTLSELMVGARVHIEGPYGTFGHSHNLEDSLQEIWIAGGIGVTPFVSLAKDTARGGERKADLYYSARTKEEAAYADELEELAKESPNFKFISHFNDTQGFLTIADIEKISGSLADKTFYICGPVPMMKVLKEKLIANGVDSKNIHTEEFSL